jgi:hypothetical protein
MKRLVIILVPFLILGCSDKGGQGNPLEGKTCAQQRNYLKDLLSEGQSCSVDSDCVAVPSVCTVNESNPVANKQFDQKNFENLGEQYLENCMKNQDCVSTISNPRCVNQLCTG